MTKTHSRLALMLTFSALTFAACGGPEDAGQLEPQGEGSGEETAEEAAVAPGTGVCFVGDSQRGPVSSVGTQSACSNSCWSFYASMSEAGVPAQSCTFSRPEGSGWTTTTLIQAGAVGQCVCQDTYQGAAMYMGKTLTQCRNIATAFFARSVPPGTGYWDCMWYPSSGAAGQVAGAVPAGRRRM